MPDPSEFQRYTQKVSDEIATNTPRDVRLLLEEEYMLTGAKSSLTSWRWTNGPHPMTSETGGIVGQVSAELTLTAAEFPANTYLLVQIEKVNAESRHRERDSVRITRSIQKRKGVTTTLVQGGKKTVVRSAGELHALLKTPA